MWDEAKQQRLDALQRRALERALTAEEQRQLETLFLGLEHAEWEAMRRHWIDSAASKLICRPT